MTVKTTFNEKEKGNITLLIIRLNTIHEPNSDGMEWDREGEILAVLVKTVNEEGEREF